MASAADTPPPSRSVALGVGRCRNSAGISVAAPEARRLTEQVSPSSSPSPSPNPNPNPNPSPNPNPDPNPKPNPNQVAPAVAEIAAWSSLKDYSDVAASAQL